MEFVLLVVAAILGGAVHYAFWRDTLAAVAFGAGWLAAALVPALAALAG
jgi:hypothetical protein